MTTIAFIGAGNMATSIISGLIDQGFPPGDIWATARTRERLETLERDLGLRISTDNAEAVAKAQVVVLAVKPQAMAEVCRGLARALPQEALVISVAAGVNCASVTTWLGGARALVRSMPNTPSLIGRGASGLYAAPGVSAAQRQLAYDIMTAVGLAFWVAEESLIDAVTAVSGSGPAYFFLLIEAMSEAGTQLGLPSDTARALALQTAYGAAELAATSPHEVVELRRRVMSPGGTTERAIASFEADHFREIVAKAMQACKLRAEEMAELLGDHPT